MNARWDLGAAAAALVMAAAGCAGAPPGHGAAYTNGRWFDGEGFPEVTVYVVEGRLTRARPATIDTTIDLAGGWVVPPFGEAHNHNVESSRFGRVNLRYLTEGIFYVKNPNSLGRFTDPIRDTLGGPRTIDAVFAGGGITCTGGHPVEIADRMIGFGRWSEAEGEGGFYWTVDDATALAAKWSAILASRPDFIKAYLLHSEDQAARIADPAMYGWRGLDPSLLADVVARAHAAGLRISVHVESAADFHVAVEAGADEVNHLPGFRADEKTPIERYRIADADARRAAERNIVVVTTVGALIEAIEHAAATEAPNVARYRALLEENLRTLSRQGVKIAIGSDRYEETAVSEALALHRLGVFPPTTLLRMWTETTAQAIFPGRAIGRLDDGAEASFLVLDGDPLQTFENVTRIRMRVKRGVPLDLPPESQPGA